MAVMMSASAFAKTSAAAERAGGGLATATLTTRSVVFLLGVAGVFTAMVAAGLVVTDDRWTVTVVVPVVEPVPFGFAFLVDGEAAAGLCGAGRPAAVVFLLVLLPFFGIVFLLRWRRRAGGSNASLLPAARGGKRRWGHYRPCGTKCEGHKASGAR
jgi:hypothetical protein